MTTVTKSFEKIQKSAWITLVILGSTDLIITYGDTMLLPSIDGIIKDYNISYSISSWIFTSYLISGAVMTPIAGKLSDIYGKKIMISIIFLIYIIGISLGGISNNIYIFLTARVIQGIGISVIPIAFGIITSRLPTQKLAIGVGIYGSIFNTGSVLGIVIGGSIIQNFGWRSTFFTIIPIAIIIWIIIIKVIPNDVKSTIYKKRDKRSNHVKNSSNNHTIEHVPDLPEIANKDRYIIDMKGAITLAIVIISFLLALTYFANTNNYFIANSTDSTYNIIILVSLTILSISTLILFVHIEKKAVSPLIPFNLLIDKILFPTNLILLILGITMFMIYQTIPILISSPPPFGFGGDAIDIVNIQLPFMIVFLIFAPFSGLIITKIGNIKPIIIGTITTTIGFVILLVFHTTEFMLSINLAIISSGLSFINVGAFNVALQYITFQFRGVSIGISVVMVLIGSSIGPVIASIFMQTYLNATNEVSGRLYPSLLSYNLIFLTATLISFVSITLAYFLKKKISQVQ